MQDAASSSSRDRSSSSKIDSREPVGGTAENFLRNIPSPKSVMDTHAIEENRRIISKGRKQLNNLNQMEVPGLNFSMSIIDLMSHIGHCFPEQTSSCNPTFPSYEPPSRDILKQVSPYLFNDVQPTPASDERFVMSKVHSLSCLLQNGPEAALNLQVKNTTGNRRTGKSSPIAASCEIKTAVDFLTPKDETDDVSSYRHPSANHERTQVGELLLNLPRIASLPQFLFTI